MNSDTRICVEVMQRNISQQALETYKFLLLLLPLLLLLFWSQKKTNQKGVPSSLVLGIIYLPAASL